MLQYTFWTPSFLCLPCPIIIFFHCPGIATIIYHSTIHPLISLAPVITLWLLTMAATPSQPATVTTHILKLWTCAHTLQQVPHLSQPNTLAKTSQLLMNSVLYRGWMRPPRILRKRWFWAHCSEYTCSLSGTHPLVWYFLVSLSVLVLFDNDTQFLGIWYIMLQCVKETDTPSYKTTSLPSPQSQLCMCCTGWQSVFHCQLTIPSCT